jgi:hypothetical protein
MLISEISRNIYKKIATFRNNENLGRFVLPWRPRWGRQVWGWRPSTAPCHSHLNNIIICQRHKTVPEMACVQKTMLFIRIRKDPKLFAGSGSVTQGYGSRSGFGSETGLKSY